jgi:DNA-binding NarL/FixJ family response regulator
LVAAGGRPRRRALRGPDALTASERRVAGLAARGLSNREIAGELVVTVRTVEFHLSRAYDKLGIGSRAELGQALDGAGPEGARP